MGNALVQITYEGRQSIKDIQDSFRKNLNQKEILKTTARAINEVAKKVQGHIRQQVRKEYTVKNAYLMKMSYISKMAKGEVSGLYANIKFSYKPVPMIAFKHTGIAASTSYNIKTRQARPITVTIRKGQAKVFKHAFIGLRKKQSENGEQYGIYSFGKYVGKKFVHNAGDKRVTELRTASPYTMSFNRTIQPKIYTYIKKELPLKLEVFLKKKLEYMAKGRK